MTQPTIGSLFTGYGGLDLAVERVTGARTAWVSDIDKGANKILARHCSEMPNLGDISAVNWSKVGPIDILTGGFPCQDVSGAGKRAGMRPDTRSGLWHHMAYAIDQLRPQLVVIENVRGLLSAKTPESEQVITFGPKGGRKVGHTNLALGRVLSDLADIGYDARWVGLRAADVGACHGRFRVFLAAYPAGGGSDWWTCESIGGAVEGTLAARAGEDLLPTPRTSDTNGVEQHGTGGLDLRTAVSLLPTPAVNDMGAGKSVEAWDAWTERMKAAHGNGNGHGKSARAALLPTPTRRDWKDGPYVANVEENALLGRAVWPLETSFGKYSDAIMRHELMLGRLAPSPTEPTGRDGAHRLSPRFVEWMMGLDDGWVCGTPDLSRNDQLKALGNGVVPQQAEVALRHLLNQRVSA